MNDSSDEDADSISKSSTDHSSNITTIRDYLFISIGEDSTVFIMHRLVQLTARV